MTRPHFPAVDPDTKLPSAAVQAAWGAIVGPALGWVVHLGGTTKAEVIATLDAAEARGKGTIAYFPAATYDLGTGLSLSGYSCQIRGAGAAMLNSTTPTGTVFYASAQSGAVLDFKGWKAPQDFSGRVAHGGFAVRGSGIADATKANIGVRVDTCESTLFSDIAIMSTGGPGLKLTSDTPGWATYLCDFERITIRTPVGASANDVPYFHSIEANCNRFRGFGFISRIGSFDTGASGAVIIEGSATFPSHSNYCDAWWFEALNVAHNGCLISVAANTHVFDSVQFVDIAPDTSATGTAFYRFLPSTVENYGGNEVRGNIPGDNGGGAGSVSMGVDVRQTGNSIVGVKGYQGNNVVVGSGVNRTFVHLRGAASGATTAGWTNNSGTTTNHLIDSVTGTEVKPSGWTATANTQIQEFTASGTWTKPSGAVSVEVLCIGAGAGGGSGRRGASGTVCGGGGGGSGGSVVKASFAAADLAGTVGVSIASAGAGAAAISVDNTNGSNGTAGGQVSFGTHVVAPGGSAGGGGSTSGGSAGGSPWLAATNSAMGSGAAGGAGTAGVGVNPCMVGPSGGPGGGGISATPAAFNGGAGASTRMGGGTGGSAGVVDTTAPTSGTAPTVRGSAGQAPGGGAASITTAAQSGATATGYGAGGAGGGASLNGNNSGAGGTGGPGYCLVITHF